MRVDPRQRLLDDIADGETGPAEAFVVVRELLVEGAPKFARRVYLAMQSVVRRLVAEPPPHAEGAEWSDVCARAGEMMLHGGETSYSNRMVALVELIDLAVHFAEAQPLDEVLRRRHHADVIRLLAENNGFLGRSTILGRLNFGQSNLTRVITALEGHGLVRRERAGREANLHLTDVGHACLARSNGVAASVSRETVWKAPGVGMTVSSVEGKLLEASDGFKRMISSPAEPESARSPFSLPLEDVRTSDGRWVRRIEIGVHESCTINLWIDISDLKPTKSVDEQNPARSTYQEAAPRSKSDIRKRKRQLAALAIHSTSIVKLNAGAELTHRDSPVALDDHYFNSDAPIIRVPVSMAGSTREFGVQSSLGSAQPVMVGRRADQVGLRRGQLPAVIYGGGQPPQSIAVDLIRTRTLIHAGGFKTTLFEINAGGKKIRAIPRDFQLDPVTGVPLHVDFLRVVAGQTVTVEVPVHFVNEDAAPGIKKLGGTLDIVAYTLSLEVAPDQIPDAIEVDLTGRQIGDVIHVSDLAIPAGIYTGDATDLVARILPPKPTDDVSEVEG